MCVHTLSHIYGCTYVYMCVYMCVCVCYRSTVLLIQNMQLNMCLSVSNKDSTHT